MIRNRSQNSFHHYGSSADRAQEVSSSAASLVLFLASHSTRQKATEPRTSRTTVMRTCQGRQREGLKDISSVN